MPLSASQRPLRNDWPFFVAIVLWLLLMAPIRPLTVPDEGRYADVARWMLVSHDWLTPRLDGLPFFHKPPLLYWIDASLFSLFGTSPFVARLAPVLAASLVCLGMMWFLRKRLGSDFARLAVLVLVTSLLFFGGSQYVNHDMLVGAGISLGILFFADGFLTGSWRSYLLGYLACGLAFISKGMIGIALPGLVLAPWIVVTGRWRQLPQALNPLGVGLLLLVTIPWFVMVQRAFPGFFNYFFVEQQVQRYLTAGFNNKFPWWFYLAGVTVSFVPWLKVVPLQGLWQRWNAIFGKELTLLLVWWPVAIIGFFSVPQSKLIGYVIPATPPIAILIAGALQRVTISRLRELAAPLFLVVIGLALCIAAALHAGGITPAESHAILLMTGSITLAGLVLTVLVVTRKIPWLLAAGTSAALWCATVAVTIAHADHKNNSPDADALASHLSDDTTLVFYHHYYYDLPFLIDDQNAVAVVEDWPKVTSDNWALELKDGTRFDNDAAQNLWSDEVLQQEIKAGEHLLVLAPPDIRPPGLETATPAFRGRNFVAYETGH